MKIRSTILRIVASLLLGIPLACCGDGGTGGSTPTEGNPVAGGREFLVEDATLRIPDHLVAIDFARYDEATIADLERRVGGEEGRRLAQQAKAIVDQGLLDFCAFDPSTPEDGFAENLNVIIAPVPPGLDRAAVVAANLAEFRRAGVTVLETDELAVGDLVFDRFRLRMDRAGSEGQAYVLLRGGKVHSVTFTACPATVESFLPASESIMRDYRPK